MRLPEFLIVGSMKCGTTTLLHALRQHPKIFMPTNELHFFNNDSNYSRGIDHYTSLFAAAGNEQLIGEKTPNYANTKCAERIRAHIPNCKLIWIFREPVSQAYSHYWHLVKTGRVRGTFPAMIRSHRVILDFSTYARQVEHYLSFFARDQFLFLRYEDLQTSINNVAEQCHHFLRLPYKPLDPSLLKHENPTRLPWSRSLQFMANKYVKNSAALALLWRINRRIRPGYPSMEPTLQAELKAHFAPFNQKLAELTGLDLSIWK